MRVHPFYARALLELDAEFTAARALTTKDEEYDKLDAVTLGLDQFLLDAIEIDEFFIRLFPDVGLGTKINQGIWDMLSLLDLTLPDE